jgi:hypothetical protein
MDHIMDVLVGVSIILITGIGGVLVRTLLRLHDSIHHIEYQLTTIKHELSINGSTDTLKERVALLQIQMRDVQVILEDIELG